MAPSIWLVTRASYVACSRRRRPAHRDQHQYTCIDAHQHADDNKSADCNGHQYGDGGPDDDTDSNN